MPQRDISDIQGAETCNGGPQQPALDGEGDYRRKVPIDSVMRGCVNEGCANHSGGYANP